MNLIRVILVTKLKHIHIYEINVYAYLYPHFLFLMSMIFVVLANLYSRSSIASMIAPC